MPDTSWKCVVNELLDQTIGPYRIEARLGKGGMGTVFRGVHLSTGQVMAVKGIHRHLAEEPHFHERFIREAQTLTRLPHPNSPYPQPTTANPFPSTHFSPPSA